MGSSAIDIWKNLFKEWYTMKSLIELVEGDVDDLFHALILTWVIDQDLMFDYTLSHSWALSELNIIHTW